LKDVNVRQALAMAIDRSAIAKAELGALPVEAVALGNHIYMETRRAIRTIPEWSHTTRRKPGKCWTRRGGRWRVTVG